MAQKKAVIPLIMLTLLLFTSLQSPVSAAPTIQRPMDFYEETVQGASPQTVDYSWAYDTASGQIIQNTMDTLIMFNGTHTDQFLPCIATSWTVTSLGAGITSNDPISGLIFENAAQSHVNATYYYKYDFKIRTGVVFQPPYNYGLTPADVAYSFQRTMIMDMSGGPQWLLQEPLLDNAAGDTVSIGGIADLTNITQVTELGQLIRDSVQYNATDVWFNLMFPGAYAPFMQILTQTWSSIESKQWIVNQVIGANGRHDWNGDWSNITAWLPFHNPTISPLDNPTPMEYGSGPFKLTALDYTLNFWSAVRYENYWGGWPASFPPLGIPPATPAGYVDTVEVTWNFNWTTRLADFKSGACDFAALDNGANIPDLYPPGTTPPYTAPHAYPLAGIRQICPLTLLGVDNVFFTFDITQSNYSGTIYPAGSGFHSDGIPADFFGNATWGLNIRKAFAEIFNYTAYLGEREAWLGTEASVPATAIIPGLTYNDPTVVGYCNPDGTPSSINPNPILDANASLNAVPGLSTTGFTLTLVYNIGNTVRYAACQLLANSLTALNPNYKVNVYGIPWNTYLGNEANHELSIFIMGWLGDFPDPHDFALPYYHTGGAFASWQKYSNATMDALIDQAIATPNGPARAALYTEIQQGAVDDCPDFVIDQPLGRHFERDWVTGWYYNVVYPGIYFYNLWKSYAASTTMSVYPGSVVVPPGGNITVAVAVTNVINLYTWQVAVKYNASVINCSAAWIPQNDVFHGGGLVEGPIINDPTTDGLNLTLINATLVYPAPPVNVSSGTLFKINFTAIEPGETSILIGTQNTPIMTPGGNWTSFLRDPNLNKMPFLEDDGQASVGGENVTILPTTNLGLTFANVTGAGSVTANEMPTVQAPILNNTVGLYYDIKVTAGYAGNVTVSLAFDGSNMTQQQKGNLTMVQYTPTPGDVVAPFGLVDIRDISYIARRFGTTPASPNWNPNADITGPQYLVPDGKVDIRDLHLVAISFGKTANWVNITTYVDTVNNVIYGQTTHFSFIGIH